MNIVQRKVSELVPYSKNAKKHDKTQIANVAESIKQYGFVQPLVIDKDSVIDIGHCRALAAKKLGMETVPCVCVDDLTPEQVRKLRIVDNKSNESDWDLELLAEDISDLDFSDFDFGFGFDEDELDEEKTSEEAAEEPPQSKVGVFSISAFGMNAECFLELVITPEQAEQIVSYVGKNGGDALCKLVMGAVCGD